MKFIPIGILFTALAVSSLAQTIQTPDRAKWMCRDLAESGNFIYQGETVFGKQACRPIPQAPVQLPAATPAPQVAVQPTPTPASEPAVKPDKPVMSMGTTAPKATVVLYRPSRFIDKARNATVYIDNRPLCILADNTHYKFEVLAGRHSFAGLANLNSTGERTLPGSEYNLAADQTYYLTLTKNWLIFAVSAQQGESEAGRTKSIKERNILVQPGGNEPSR